MVINPSNLSALFVAFDVRFKKAYDNATEPWSPKVASQVPSSTTTSTYAWPEKVPILTPWVADRKSNNVIGRGYSLTNIPFELTMVVDRHKLEDDQYGVYQSHVDMMAVQARKWPDYQIADALLAGSTALGFDDVAFFSTSHPVKYGVAGSPTYSNYAASGVALTPTNYALKRAESMSVLAYDGKPFGVMPNLLLVPPQLEAMGRLILNADMIPNSAGTAPQTNILKGSAELLVVPELATEATAWYLLDVSKPIKPFIFQIRQAPLFVYKTDPAAEANFKRHEYEYGVEARGAAGYTLPYLAAKYVA